MRSIVSYNLTGACIPPYIPKSCSVREILLHHLDIRAVVKKVIYIICVVLFCLLCLFVVIVVEFSSLYN